jgi:hypothetical protein
MARIRLIIENGLFPPLEDIRICTLAIHQNINVSMNNKNQNDIKNNKTIKRKIKVILAYL